MRLGADWVAAAEEEWRMRTGRRRPPAEEPWRAGSESPGAV